MRRQCSIRRLVVLAPAVAAMLAAVAVAAGAPPDFNQHTGPDLETFPDQLCGIDGTTTNRFVGNFTLYADGTFLSTSNFRQTFTSASNGKQVVSSGVEQVKGPFDPTDNGDGTITQTFTFKGQPVRVSVANGPTLLRDAGFATVAITFVLNPDGSRGDFLSQTVVAEHGPHPGLDDDALFCTVVVAALG
jgi:hypothetical protein